MLLVSLFFFFNDTATTEIYTLSLHDALPICLGRRRGRESPGGRDGCRLPRRLLRQMLLQHLLALLDRKSTRLNSSHQIISYAVFCLKKKKLRNSTEARSESHSLQVIRNHLRR